MRQDEYRQINTPNIEFAMSPFFNHSRQSPFSSPYMGLPASCAAGDHRDDFYGFSLNDLQPKPVKEEHEKPRCRTSEELYRDMVELMVGNVASTEEALRREWTRRNQVEDPLVLDAFAILFRKFKKLKKTKEEMTKYCMRKAFKHLGEKMRNEGLVQRGDTEFNLKYYCGDLMGEELLSIPFRKNSVEKTMNASFLKKIFSSSQFIRDYMDFLKMFDQLARDDNERKIVYLAQIVHEAVKAGNVARLESVKRLPWTAPMLARTEELATKLLQYRPGHLKDMTDSFLQRRQAEDVLAFKHEEREEDHAVPDLMGNTLSPAQSFTSFTNEHL
jgi:hypothetical protein